MDSKTFFKAVAKKFKFKKTKPVLKTGQAWAFKEKKNTFVELTALNHIELEDADAHFSAEVIAMSGPSEIIHITQPGKYFDHVYFSDHSKLYALEYLEDSSESERAFGYLKINRAKYAKMPPIKRLAAMPFIKSPLAKTLQEFFDKLEVVTQDELEGKPKAKSAAAAPKADGKLKHARAWVKNSVYLEAKPAKKFALFIANGAVLQTVMGSLGKAGNAKYERFKSPAELLAKTDVVIDKLLGKGFKFSKLKY